MFNARPIPPPSFPIGNEDVPLSAEHLLASRSVRDGQQLYPLEASPPTVSQEAQHTCKFGRSTPEGQRGNPQPAIADVILI